MFYSQPTQTQQRRMDDRTAGRTSVVESGTQPGATSHDGTSRTPRTSRSIPRRIWIVWLFVQKRQNKKRDQEPSAELLEVTCPVGVWVGDHR